MRFRVPPFAVVVLLAVLSPCLAEARSAVFAGGPVYSGGRAVMDALRASGFTTVIIWTIHVDARTGDLMLNDERIISRGRYIGRADWPEDLATLKSPPTSVARLEVAVGSWGVRDFEAIQERMSHEGTGADSVLRRNFAELRRVTGADAIDFDDETQYDVDTAVRFGLMVADLGYKISLCPYKKPAFWAETRTALERARPGVVDRLYVQVYAGGAGNDPAVWAAALGAPVQPGLWSRHGSDCGEGDSPDAVRRRMQEWRKSPDVIGGFMWLLDDMLRCAEHGTAADYAAAVNAAAAAAEPES